MKIFTDWKDFFKFVRTPDYVTTQSGILSKTLLTINSFILKILVIVLIAICYGIYVFISGDLPDNMLKDATSIYHPIVLFTMVAIFEEFSFRGFLAKFNPLLFAISVSGIVSIYYKKIVFRNMMFEFDGLLEAGILFVVIFAIAYLIARKYSNQLTRFWENNFKILVYLSAFLFAFVHFFNSPDLSLSYLKTNIFQLISAFILTFVRIRSGIVYAIVIHFVCNFILGV